MIRIDLQGSPITHIPPNVQRLLNGIENRRREQNRGNGIYTNQQSVHNHNIQMHIRESVMNLLRDPKSPTIEQTVVEIVTHPLITNTTKELLMEYT